jgi:hypothetical protein
METLKPKLNHWREWDRSQSHFGVLMIFYKIKSTFILTKKTYITIKDV